MNIVKDGLLKLYANDIIKNIINVIGITVLLVLYNLVTAADFDLFKVDYIALLQNILNVSVVAVIADLGRRFLTNNKGSFLGVTPEDDAINK